MIQENLQKLSFSEGPHAKSIEKKIQGLSVEKLHKIKGPGVKDICDEVIISIEKCLLVRIDEDLLKKRMLKNEKNKPLRYTEHEVNINSANIRNDWGRKKGGVILFPEGYIYRNRELILGLIYRSESYTDGYCAFIEKEIANNPHGANLFLVTMKEDSGIGNNNLN